MEKGIALRSWVGLLAAVLVGCSGGAPKADYSSSHLPPRGSSRPPADEGTNDDPVPTDSTDPPAADPPPAAAPDADGDGVPDAQDCAPNDATNKMTKLLEGGLVDDQAKFAPAPGFPTASWTYGAAGYLQTRLVDAADAALFADAGSLHEVDIDVDAASTEISSAITPRDRQMFILLGAKTSGGTITAYGCGAEVIQGMTPEQRTSVVKISGAASAPDTTALERTARTAVQQSEDFSLHATVKGTTITCTMTQDKTVVTTATATVPSVTDVTGAIGFYTRQTKAAWKTAKVCAQR